MPRKFRAKQREPAEPPRRVPRYCGPHATGQAYSIWPAGTPNAGKHRYHGSFNTPESHENYRRWLVEMKFAGPDSPALSRPFLTIAEVYEQWLAWVEQRGLFRKHDRATHTLTGYHSAMRFVLQSYASMFLQDFRPYHLAMCREAMIRDGLARSTINSYIGRFKKVWRWAVAHGLLENEDYLPIEQFEPLHEREGGYESLRVLSVSEDLVRQVLEVVSAPVRAILEICCWSGCRVGEARLMRTCDIHDEDPLIPQALAGQCWVYRPMEHKSEHHQTRRIILLGPQAIGIIEPWLRPDEPEQFVFQPYEAAVYRNRRGRNYRGKPTRASMDVHRPYGETSIYKAVRTACVNLGVPIWHPHQLRHLAATRLASRYGVEITQILLGHTDPKTTLKYVDPNVLTKDDRDRYSAAIRAIIEHG